MPALPSGRYRGSAANIGPTQNVEAQECFASRRFGVIWMGRVGLETYAGYTRCQHCGIYDTDPRWCDLCGMRKESRGPLDRKGRGAACAPNNAVFKRRAGEPLVAGRAGTKRWSRSVDLRHAGGRHAIG